MSYVTPSQDDALTALRLFILNVVPPFNAYVGAENRVPEPKEPDFALMTPIRFQRLSTNEDSNEDVKFTGSIASNVAAVTGQIVPASTSIGETPYGILTVAGTSATLALGCDITGADIAQGTYITGQLSGPPGGIGSYKVNIPQTSTGNFTASWGVMTVSAIAHGSIMLGASLFGVGVAANSVIRAGTGPYIVSPAQSISSETLSSGAKALQQNARMTIQVDFHSESGNAADAAQAFSTAFRDDFGTRFFAGLSSSITPFHADDPRYAPFQNENQQIEYRWVVDAEMQVNQVIVLPQQFADKVEIARVPVDAFYVP